MHLLDEGANVDWDRRSTATGLNRAPAPMPGEQAAMPRDDSSGFHDLHGTPPAAPHSREQHPKDSVGSTEPESSRRGLLEDGELVAEG